MPRRGEVKATVFGLSAFVNAAGCGLAGCEVNTGLAGDLMNARNNKPTARKATEQQMTVVIKAPLTGEAARGSEGLPRTGEWWASRKLMEDGQKMSMISGEGSNIAAGSFALLLPPNDGNPLKIVCHMAFPVMAFFVPKCGAAGCCQRI
jgi:hypothetical protein